MTLRRGRGKAQKTLHLMEHVVRILAEIQPTTVRSVAYQCFVAGLIGSMKKSETNRLSSLLVEMRKTGQIPWSWIVDETREAECVSAWQNPSDYVITVQNAYRRDRWTSQTAWIEVWAEKGTIRGVLKPVLDRFGVTFRVMHGYSSATVLHDIARQTQAANKLLTVLYLGDYDPSGLHMSNVDIPARLEEMGAGLILFNRLAITPQDAYADRLPSFDVRTKGPTKESKGDSRYAWWMQQQFGLKCYELDALNPVELRSRVQQEIEARIDWPAWKLAESTESAELDSLKSILSTWPGRAHLETISRQAQE